MTDEPNPNVYWFEDALETACQGWLTANGINDPAKQRDEKIEGQTLTTPRVECKCIFGGFDQNEHYYVRQSDGARWLDIGAGQLFVKIVTRREPGDSTHSILRGMCRQLMQHADEISALMPLHQIEKIIEQPTAVNIDDSRKHDISALGFAVWLRIRSTAFPVIP